MSHRTEAALLPQQIQHCFIGCLLAVKSIKYKINQNKKQKHPPPNKQTKAKKPKPSKKQKEKTKPTKEKKNSSTLSTNTCAPLNHHLRGKLQPFTTLCVCTHCLTPTTVVSCSACSALAVSGGSHQPAGQLGLGCPMALLPAWAAAQGFPARDAAWAGILAGIWG